MTVAHDEAARWLVMTHAPAGRPRYAVAANLAATTQDVPLEAGPVELLLAWDPTAAEDCATTPCGCRVARPWSSTSPERAGRSGTGQASGMRSMPSWATVATRVPSAVNIRPMPRPRPPWAEGECCA